VAALRPTRPSEWLVTNVAEVVALV
jgi:hypothetical protein